MKATEKPLLSRSIIAGVAVAGAIWSGEVKAEGSDLRVFDWSGYEDSGFFQPYMDKHGSAPSYAFFGSEEEAYTKLRSGFSSDLAHPCIGVTRKWADAGLIKPLDTTKIKNWDQLLPTIKTVSGVAFDGKTWMMPFDWGNSGLIYRTDKVDAEKISLDLVTGPEFEGKVAIPDIVTSAYAMASLAIGLRDWTNMTDAQFKEASAYLRKLHKNVRFYWSDPGQLDQALASGEIVAGWGWNQTELNLLANKTPATMMKDVDKGVATWVCGYVHLANGTMSDEQVYDMLNALSDVNSGKYIIEAWGYAHANADAYGKVDPALVKSYGFDNAEVFLKESLLTSALDPKTEAKMTKEFERIKAGF
ncbi:extracellular solute-binding protein [Pelagibius sp. Alg239-R121]|uniref:extracellular solute-binding protein n=1 Tax=Pelagibius sp. Alg239-R121 TaxID=2993448 RepID=UPI0024A64030|nr:extracellular solute-binding protein [Pelagibius sp. Alg239-R121]